MNSVVWIPVLIGFALSLHGGETDAEKIVREGITKFRTNVRSTDEEVRKKALAEIMPTEKFLVYAFGEDGKTAWPLMETGIKELMANTDKFKAEMDARGDLQEVKLYDPRKEDGSMSYTEILKIIPKDLPLFRAVTKTDKGSSGSSTYLVYEGKMLWVQGFQIVPKLAERVKAGKKP